MARHESTEWNPLVLGDWTLELGQAMCTTVSPSPSSLKSLETIEIRDLALRLRSGVKLMESTIIAAESTETIIAMSSRVDNNMGTGGLSKINFAEFLNVGDTLDEDDQLILGFVRCEKRSNK